MNGEYMSKEVSIYNRERLNEIINDLSTKEITIEEILKADDVLYLLKPYTLRIISQDANWRYRKWVAKRGKNLPDGAKSRTQKGFFVRRVIEEVVKQIIGYYGITGGIQIYYLCLAGQITKRIKTKPLTRWVNIIKERIKYWVEFRGCEPKVAHAVALATAKAFYYYYIPKK